MTQLRTVQLNKPKVSQTSLPAVLTVAGSDNSGGAGIEADLKTFTAHEVYGLTCITALTAQNTQMVESFEKTSESHLKKILERNFDDFVRGYHDSPLKTIKTGMLTQEAVNVLVEYLEFFQKNSIRLVVDPVMVSTTGSSLFDKEAMKKCVDTLIKQAYLVTPNFVEAQALLKIKGADANLEIESLDDFVAFVVKVQKALGCKNILVKGGHIPWSKKTNSPFTGNFETHAHEVQVIDILYQSETDSVVVYESEFILTQDTHGTGCTLSSAIASNLAKGFSLEKLVPLSINYIHKGILSLEKKLGHGHGPLNHTAKPERALRSFLSSECVTDITTSHSTVLNYFKSHPAVKENWANYIKHQFVYDISLEKLPFEQFLYFLKQDFYYLVNYAQVHALAASVAPNYQQIHDEALIMENVITEIEKHKSRLQKEYNINYDNADLDVELRPGRACLNYCNYLLEIGKREDYLGVKVALAPCLHGYYEAAVIATAERTKFLESNQELAPHSDIYQAWIDDYNSDWYFEAYNSGVKSLQEAFDASKVSPERLDELVHIFSDVTKLEVDFWTEVVEHSQP